MNRHTIFATFKFSFAMLIAAAVVTQIAGLIDAGVFNPANFFSFFTIESNLIIAVIFALSGYGHFTGRHFKNITFLRGAAALYMVVTGIVYITLLSGQQEALNTNIPWVNFVLHYFIPTAALVDWLVDRPHKEAVSLNRAMLWLAFPIVWLTYSLIRGPITGWYPYPFLDPNTGGGLTEVIVVCIVISVLLAGLSLLLVWLGDLNPARRLKKLFV